MLYQPTLESEMENNLIRRLVEGDSQWKYRDDLKTEEDLWNNIREKININNPRDLKENPLTDQEFEMIKNQLTFVTFYDAARFLQGENGICKVKLQREDARLGTVHLLIINQMDIAAGTSDYEIINQYRFEKGIDAERSRRFDVTFLINGLPLIQVELKNNNEGYMSAFNQIGKYIDEGAYRGVFSTLQMFVVSNGANTRYIAPASSSDKLNPSFLSRWVDEDNSPVENLFDFADRVLTFPQAHKMVAEYTVLDTERKTLILMRPYQIHAIEAIKKASVRREPGYIWHTTGSGKTLTSYKTARNLMRIPSIDKTIFIVDRRDLDQQTTSSFESYSENDVIEIDKTDNVSDLIRKLLSPDRTVIITTIQKLNHVMRRMFGKEESAQYKKLTSLNLAFIVDECHRAVSPEKKQEIEKFFYRSLWYGFTGTPIFAENARAEQGDLARTTEELYGRCLHEYTVKEAIKDHAVLGFNVEYKSTLREDDVDDIISELNPGLDVYSMNKIEKEALLPKEIYEDEDHMLKVIDSIINESRSKLGLGRGGNQLNNTAILTTSSINKAQRYYDLFQETIAGNTSVKISERTRKAQPDFPKVAITYSLSENEDSSRDNQLHLSKAIDDYNQMYGTQFNLSTVPAYNRNVNERLARKKDFYRFNRERLDIVIVVDRLLTGFDAPCLSTLFIDRQPMKPQDIIQAFSRTNRLFDKQKSYGQIVTYQTPAIFEEKVNEAIFLYSNGGESEVMAPTWTESKAIFEEALANLRSVAPTSESVDEMSKEKKRVFAKAYQEFDKSLSALRVYMDFDADNFEADYQITYDEIENYTGKYQNVIDELKEERDEEDPFDFDIDYTLTSFKTTEINYQYIVQMLQVMASNPEVTTDEDSSDNMAEVLKYIKDYAKTNPKYGQVLEGLYYEIINAPSKFKDVDIIYEIQNRIDQRITHVINDYSNTYKVLPEDFRYLVNNYNPSHDRQIGDNELIKNADLDAYKAEADEKINKLRYRKTIREGYKDVIENEILPYRQVD